MVNLPVVEEPTDVTIHTLNERVTYIHNDMDTQFTGSLRQIPFFSTNACAEEKKCGGSRIFGAVISFVVLILYLTMMAIGIVYYNVCQDTRVAIYNVVQGAFCSLGALLFFIAFAFKSEAASYPIVITPLIYLFSLVWGCIGVYWVSYYCQDTPQYIAAVVFSGPIAVSFALIIGFCLKVYCG